MRSLSAVNRAGEASQSRARKHSQDGRVRPRGVRGQILPRPEPAPQPRRSGKAVVLGRLRKVQEVLVRAGEEEESGAVPRGAGSDENVGDGNRHPDR